MYYFVLFILYVLFFCECYLHHRHLHGLPHPFPPRRSSDLSSSAIAHTRTKLHRFSPLSALPSLPRVFQGLAMRSKPLAMPRRKLHWRGGTSSSTDRKSTRLNSSQ